MQVFRLKLTEMTGQTFEGEDIGPTFVVNFAADSIELELPDPPIGWKVSCLTHPAVSYDTKIQEYNYIPVPVW